MRMLGIVAPSAAYGDRAPGSTRPVKLREQKHNRTWTKKDEGILRKMLAEGESVEKIALKLKRTRQAIGARASRLHLKWGN